MQQVEHPPAGLDGEKAAGLPATGSRSGSDPPSILHTHDVFEYS